MVFGVLDTVEAKWKMLLWFLIMDRKNMGTIACVCYTTVLVRNTERLYYISSIHRIYISAFYIEDKVCNTSMCAIQVNKVGLKPT